MTGWSVRNERRSGSVMIWDNLPIRTEHNREDLGADGPRVRFEPTGIVPSRPIWSLRINRHRTVPKIISRASWTSAWFPCIFRLCWCCSPPCGAGWKLRANPAIWSSRDYNLAGSYPLTYLTLFMSLPGAHTPASIALRVIAERGPPFHVNGQTSRRFLAVTCQN